MNRRELFGALIGSVAGVATPLPPARKYGLVDIQSWSAHRTVTGESLHVFVEGVDVTTLCHEANDIEGYVRLRCRGEEAAAWLARGAVHEGHYGLRVTGAVVIIPGAPL